MCSVSKQAECLRKCSPRKPYNCVTASSQGLIRCRPPSEKVILAPSVHFLIPTSCFCVYPPHRSFPFHTIAKMSTVRRKRCDVEAESSSNKLAFSLSLSNVTHSFEMTPSTDIFSPCYILDEVPEDGRLMTVPNTVKDCYYIQDIRET